jgi:hypothetical protein
LFSFSSLMNRTGFRSKRPWRCAKENICLIRAKSRSIVKHTKLDVVAVLPSGESHTTVLLSLMVCLR